MRESRTYGSGRGACDETHVPTATTARVHRGTWRRCGVAARGARRRSYSGMPSYRVLERSLARTIPGNVASAAFQHRAAVGGAL